MHAYEPYRHQQQYLDEQYDSETNSMESYPHNHMESFDFNTSIAFNNPLPFSFAEMSSTYAEAPMDSKYQMMRSISNHSNNHTSYEMPPALLSSGSVGSSSSSTVGSPYSAHINMMPAHEGYPISTLAYLSPPTIMSDDGFRADFSFAEDSKLMSTFVDPILINGAQDSYFPYAASATLSQPCHHGTSVSPAPSPAPSTPGYPAFGQPLTVENYNTHHRQQQRRMSISSQRSGNSSPRGSSSGDNETGEKAGCPYPDCGKSYKDLKAHMLTHMSERPEKCPIVTCEYHLKGFARKYDKNRHTLTHYKGTMVCGFCPGSGSPAEKSFNRADVFKRHLTSVHGVEQNPPNSRKRIPGSSNTQLSSYCEDATGKCSTCSACFNNAQDFYEHLDDCVLKVVQQEDPREAVNAHNLTTMTTDPSVQETMERNHIKAEESPYNLDEEEDDDDEEEEDEDDEEMGDEDEDQSPFVRAAKPASKRSIINGNITKKTKKRGGMTWSKGGVPLTGRSRRRRKDYPPSWGMAAEKMKKRKRVLCVYEGPRRLLKDDMMLFNEHEVRIRLPDGNNYVTDLDIETLKRAEAFHNATAEEKGPWLEGPDFLNDLMG